MISFNHATQYTHFHKKVKQICMQRIMVYYIKMELVLRASATGLFADGFISLRLVGWRMPYSAVRMSPCTAPPTRLFLYQTLGRQALKSHVLRDGVVGWFREVRQSCGRLAKSARAVTTAATPSVGWFEPYGLEGHTCVACQRRTSIPSRILGC
jgi:hypothetical protein